MDNVLINDLFSFLNASPTPYHGVAEAAERLRNKGWEELSEKSSWQLKENSGYFVIRNGSSLIAFHTGILNPADKGFRIIAAHTDSPTFRLKNGAVKDVKGVMKNRSGSTGRSHPFHLARQGSLRGGTNYR